MQRTSLHSVSMGLPSHSKITSYDCRCSKPGKLQCPKCLELDLPKVPSIFCSQDCFKVGHHSC